MVTGIETVGLILAVLPLIVNQLDAYAEGIEELKTFRTKKYRRRFEEYSTRLGTQHAILLNTLEQVLEGLLEYEDDISELIQNPRGAMWSDPVLQQKLIKKLDRNYAAFSRTMTEVSTLLETLAKKLELETANPLKISWNESSIVEREIKKFKVIFSKSVYTSLLSNVENANAALKTLVDQSDHRQGSRRTHRVSKRPLMKYKMARKHASGLYNAIVHGQYWKCACKDSHSVHLRIEPQTLSVDDEFEAKAAAPKIRVAFSSKTNASNTGPEGHWHEIETIPVLEDTPIVPSKPPVTFSTFKQASQTTKVTFAIATSTLQSLPLPKPPDNVPAPPISDLCSSLCSVKSQQSSKVCVGSISDDKDPSHKYYMFLVEQLDNIIEMQSLEDMLNPSLKPAGSHVVGAGFRLSRRDRLFLAATLASSVLRFHGSWLKPQWTSRDILFPKAMQDSKSIIEHPYLSAHEIGPRGTINPTIDKLTHALIRSDVLFPLGLALIELSLCQSISTLRKPGEEDSVEAIANLKTASRVLDDVYFESGGRYRDVVDKCLFWSETRNSKADDDDFQKLVFQYIVSPLLEDLGDFDGKLRIR